MARRSARLFVALAIVLFLSLKTIPFAQQPINTSGTVDTSAAVPRLVAFGGVLRDGKGQPLSGVVGVTLSIYKDQQSGAPLWTENQNVQLDELGRYSVLLGATQASGLPMDLFNSSDSHWLGVRAQLPGELEQPRVLMVSVPYALHAANADTIGGKPPSAFVLAEPVDQTETAGASSDSIGNRLEVRPRSGTVSGATGTTNALTKWLNGSGLLGDSLVYEVNGKVGVNNPNPIGQFDLAGASSIGAEAGGLHVTDTNVIPNKVIQIGYDDATDVGFIRSFQSSTAGRPLVLNPQAGNVGIGTTNPIGQLDISTQATYNQEFGGFHVTNNATNPSKVAQMGFDNNLDAGFIRAYQSSTGVKPLLLNPQGGFVGIGTTSPAATLDVAGNLKVSGGILGTLALPAGGALQINGTPFLHNYGTDNTFVGGNAGNMSMTGHDNTADGFNALGLDTTGNNNTATGSAALQSNTTGSTNTASGAYALQNNTTGTDNTASGVFALQNNTAAGNTANGAYALKNNTTGTGNVAGGLGALGTNTTGNYNAASGYLALQNNTIGFYNTANGAFGLGGNTSGAFNTVAGAGALYSNTTGNSNTAIGYQAGYTANNANANVTGSSNTFIGFHAGPGTPTQLTNATAIGANALVSASNTLVLGAPGVSVAIGAATAGYTLDVQGGQINSSGGFCINGSCLTSWPLISNGTNTSLGTSALSSNTSGFNNTADGTNALQNNTTGTQNTAIGANSLQTNTTGSLNTAAGLNALHDNTTGTLNSAYGVSALRHNTIGTENTGTGISALLNNTTGNDNAAGGAEALFTNTTGINNTAFGAWSGVTGNSANGNTSGSNNTFIGYQAGPGTPSEIDNATAIGANAIVSASNTIVLGAPGISVVIGASTAATTFQVVGDIRVGTSGTNGCIQGFDGSPLIGTCSSDMRLKQNIEPFAQVLDKVTQLQPVSYNWRADEHPEYHFGSERTSGLIAQEVEKVFPNMVATDERGYKAVNYSQLPLLLLEAVRELKSEKDVQQLQIHQLLSELEAMEARLKAAEKR